MNPELKTERNTVHRKARTIRYKVVCKVLYTHDLGREEAFDEVSIANVECDCGGTHHVEVWKEKLR